jgi:hypothetical protein
MQNEPNLLNAQMNANKVLTKDYENVHLLGHPKNKAKTKPIFVPPNPLIVYNASKYQNACLKGLIYAEQNR